jgi:ribose transport system permease protein
VIDFLMKDNFLGLSWGWFGVLGLLGLALTVVSFAAGRLTRDHRSLLRWTGVALVILAALNGLIQWYELGVPWSLVLMLLLAALLGIVLHTTVYGRYLYAIGANEQAARYAGIASSRYKILTYVWCSMMVGVAGIFFVLENGGANPANDGNFYELYAITGAVLGGCSLRGGEGTIVGIVLGAAILPLLRNIILFAGVPDDVEFAVVGLALLLGTIIDEALKRRAAARV